MKRKRGVKGSRPLKRKVELGLSKCGNSLGRLKQKHSSSVSRKEDQEVCKKDKGKKKVDFQKRSTLMKCKLEYQRLMKEQINSSNPPTGMYTLPGRDVTEWHGVKFVQDGPYKGLILKLFFKFPSRFPHEQLIIKSFQPKPQDMFHPMVHPLTGVIQCFATPSPIPPRSKPFINEILNGLNDVFENPQFNRWSTDDCQNPNALTLAVQNQVLFTQKVQQCIHCSFEGKYVNHPNSLIRFNPLSEVEYEMEKAKLCSQENLEAIGVPHQMLDMKPSVSDASKPQETVEQKFSALLDTSFGAVCPSNNIFAANPLNESRILPPRHSIWN